MFTAPVRRTDRRHDVAAVGSAHSAVNLKANVLLVRFKIKKTVLLSTNSKYDLTVRSLSPHPYQHSHQQMTGHARRQRRRRHKTIVYAGQKTRVQRGSWVTGATLWWSEEEEALKDYTLVNEQFYFIYFFLMSSWLDTDARRASASLQSSEKTIWLEFPQVSFFNGHPAANQIELSPWPWCTWLYHPLNQFTRYTCMHFTEAVVIAGSLLTVTELDKVSCWSTTEAQAHDKSLPHFCHHERKLTLNYEWARQLHLIKPSHHTAHTQRTHSSLSWKRLFFNQIFYFRSKVTHFIFTASRSHTLMLKTNCRSYNF